jgi:hypothetical protein
LHCLLHDFHKLGEKLLEGVEGRIIGRDRLSCWPGGTESLQVLVTDLDFLLEELVEDLLLGTNGRLSYTIATVRVILAARASALESTSIKLLNRPMASS